MTRLLLALFLSACTQTDKDGELLPKPTGPHPVGRNSFHWIDAERPELETAAEDDRRELMVHVFYPCGESKGERAAYMPDAEIMKGAWPDQFAEIVPGLKAHAIESAPLLSGDSRFPVVLLSPGGGMKGLTYHSFAEDLASHGYVVAVIDPPYNAPRVRVPDGRVLGNLTPDKRGWPQPKNFDEHLRFYQERIVHWSRDLSFVLDRLTALNAKTEFFAGRLDLDRGVGALGHSRGGQAAGTVRLMDERFKAGINLDGAIREYAFMPVNGQEDCGKAPFLWIQKAFEPPPTPEQLQRAGRTREEYDKEIARIFGLWHGRLAAVKDGAINLMIDRPQIEHIDFSDEPLWNRDLDDEARRRKLATIADARAWIRAFFDATLLQRGGDLERLLTASRPEWAVKAFGSFAPTPK